MAAPLAGLALRSVSGALMKQGGRAAASKLLGRKKKMQPGKSKPGAQQVDGEKKGALVVRPQTSIVSIPPSMAEPADVSASTTSSDSGYIEVINEKVIEIKNLLKGTLAAEKKEEDDRKRTEKRENRKKQEAKLEKKGSKKKNKMKGIDMPRTGFFDSLFGFISNTILGFFAVRLIEYLPQILGFLKFLAPIGEFLIDVGIGLIDGFASFVDLGYKAYDFTRGALENIGGEGLANAFDGLMKAIDLAITVFTFGLLANKTMGGGLFGGKDKAPKTRIRTGPEEAFQAGRPKRMRAPGTTSQGAADRYTRRFGDRAAKRRFGQVPGKTGGSKLPFKMPSAKALKVGGGIFSAVMAGFEFAGRKGAGQTNLQAGVGTAASVGGGLAGAAKGAAVGAMFGPIGALIGGVIGGVGGSMLASGVADQVTGANKMNEGGGVGSASSGSTPSQQPDDKDRKKPSYTPIKVPEGGKIVLEEKTEKAWWDFLGWAGTEGQEKSIELGAGGMFLAKRVADVGNAFGKDEYFGPILSIASKFILGQKPDDQEYKNVGYGINLLVGDGVDDNAIRSGYSEGGVVQAAMAGVDISGWVTKTFKKELAQAINKNYDMSESTVVSGKKKKEQEEGSTAGPGSAAGVRDTATGELLSLGSGGGSLKDMSDQDFSDLAFIVSKEAARGTDDEYGVAAAVLNRVADPRFPNTIMDVGTAPGQFEAVYKGLAVRDEELAKKLKDNQGKIVEALKELQGRTDFKGQSQLDNMGDTDIMFDSKGNFYHYLEQVGKTDPVPASIPQDWKKLLGESTGEQFTPSSPSSSSASEPAEKTIIKGDTISGSDIVSIGKDLGSKGFAIAEHPDFTKTTSGGRYTPGKGSVSSVHKGRGHYEGRAIDVTQHAGGDPEYKQTYLPVLDSLANNPAIKMLIHDTWGFYKDGKKSGPGSHGHPEHMHIEVKDKGGFIGKGLFANLGGKEFVTDADSTAALGQVAPGLQLALNQAKDASGVEEALQQYASYDMRGEQTVVVPQPAPPVPTPMPQYGSSSMMNFSAGRSENFSEFLDFQG